MLVGNFPWMLSRGLESFMLGAVVERTQTLYIVFEVEVFVVTVVHMSMTFVAFWIIAVVRMFFVCWCKM